VTRRSYHLFLFRYVEDENEGLSRERFLEALRAEGIPAWSGYSMPLQKQPLFTDRKRLAADIPETCLYNGLPPDYGQVETPVTDRLCKKEAVWLGQSMLLGPPEDIQDILHGVEKVITHRKELLEGK
jgi:dTDP-4-amino-4,6-dideoxygalactose transaminase